MALPALPHPSTLSRLFPTSGMLEPPSPTAGMRPPRGGSGPTKGGLSWPGGGGGNPKDWEDPKGQEKGTLTTPTGSGPPVPSMHPKTPKPSLCTPKSPSPIPLLSPTSLPTPQPPLTIILYPKPLLAPQTPPCTPVPPPTTQNVPTSVTPTPAPRKTPCTPTPPAPIPPLETSSSQGDPKGGFWGPCAPWGAHPGTVWGPSSPSKPTSPAPSLGVTGAEDPLSHRISGSRGGNLSFPLLLDFGGPHGVGPTPPFPPSLGVPGGREGGLTEGAGGGGGGG